MEYDTTPTGGVKASASSNGVHVLNGHAQPPDDAALFLKSIFDPGDVFELRMFGCVGRGGEKQVVSGYFDHDHIGSAALAARTWTAKAEGVFVTMNPVDPALLARCPNRVKAAPERATTDKEIVRRGLVVIDLDPVRPAKVSATDDEKRRALEKAGEILEEFHRRGFPPPILVDSGNGYHPVYRVDLPADDDGLVKRFLQAAHERWTDDHVKVDTSVSNPSRVSKLPGTWARKGESTEERPHRMAKIVTMPRTFEVVPTDLLRAFAPKPEPPPKRTIPAPKRSPRDSGRLDAATRARLCVMSDRHPDAIEGSHGHDVLYSAAVAIIDGFGLGFDEGYPILSDFNQAKAVPPESDYQVRHKLESAISKHPTPSLRLLNAPPPNGRVPRNGQANGKPAVEGLPAKAARVRFTNYATTTEDDPATGRLQTTRTPLSAADIDRLHAEVAGELPYRVGDRLFIPGPDHEPVYLETSARLFAFYDDRADVRWSKAGEVISEQRWFERRRDKARKFSAIETRPHFPPVRGVYYMHRKVPASSAGALDELMARFSPETSMDGELLKAMVLTWFWGGRPGARPSFVFTGPKGDPHMGRGVGKSTNASLLADELLQGWLDASKSDDVEALKTRLLSSEMGRKRVAIVDNIKTHRFSNAGLEGLITAATISGRGLYVGEAERPNLLNWVLTVNGASLSKDMAQRSVVIRLGRPTYRPDWEDDVRTHIRENLWAIIADVRDRLAAASAISSARTRWATWERDVLGKLQWADCLQKLIVERQGEVDNDDDERTTVVDAIREKLEGTGRDPDRSYVLIPNSTFYAWIEEATRTKRSTTQIVGFVGGLEIPNLRKNKGGAVRGWYWKGDDAMAVQAEHLPKW